MYEEKIIPPKKAMPQAQDGTLRKFALRVPKVIYQCSGIMVFGKRIKSLVFSTDLSIIKNVNADAIIAVYPFTPQPIITQALLLAADIPVFAGVGGGLTKGQRVVNLAMFAEMQGATGVVVNAPTANTVVQHVAETIDIPVVVTVARADTDFEARLQAGANIFNVSAAAETPAIVRSIRERYPDVPIIATGGPTDESILETIRAGANAITWTPPTNGEIFRDIMAAYRDNKPHSDPVHGKTDPNACPGRFFALIAASVRPRGKTAARAVRCKTHRYSRRRTSSAFPSPLRRDIAAGSAGGCSCTSC